MMIKSFAYVGQQFNREDYIDTAINAANYLLQTNQTSNELLSRSSLAGQTSIPALQEDYACLAEALLQIYDATLNISWLEKATVLANKMIQDFWYEENGGFFMNTQGKENLLPASPKEIKDNATSSGNSVALRVLVRLTKRTGSQHFQTYAQQLIRAYSDDITQRPYICSYLICGLIEMLSGEQSSKQWCAEGNIYISTAVSKKDNQYKIILSIKINKDWHLNPISDENNIPSPLKIETSGEWIISDIQYPEPATKTLGFQTEPVNVYSGNINLTLFVSSKNQPDSNKLKFIDSIGLNYRPVTMRNVFHLKL